MDEIQKPDYITLADFQKIQLRVGEVLSVEELPHSEKLLKLQVKVGEETRQVLAGIKKSYSPEQLVGKKVVVVFNFFGF
jgi:methionyl-tRNA synthetase